MALVAYSDSEDSDTEQPQPKLAPKPQPSTTFAVNKSNPRKIQVKLTNLPLNGDAEDGEPAPKRQRIGDKGAGAFSGFNAMLPPPKRDADVKVNNKPAARKVFSLKTGAEPGFSREADAELRELFATQHGTAANGAEDENIPSIPKSVPLSSVTQNGQTVQGNAFMFKPLSVARGNKKTKKKVLVPKMESNSGTSATSRSGVSVMEASTTPSTEPASPPKKVSLFSLGADAEPALPDPVEEDDDDEIIEVLDEDPTSASPHTDLNAPSAPTAQHSLSDIATDLNLSKAARRQLFGRAGPSSNTTTPQKIITFNTDAEYAANEELRATGETIQHNPVRAIASGKHSLKQLVGAAVGQKDALEESFATGRRNKREAGNKYGW